MDKDTTRFVSCTRPEHMLLEDLAREFRRRVQIKRIETPHSLQLLIVTDTPELRDFIYMLLVRLRRQQRELECIYRKPAAARPPLRPLGPARLLRGGTRWEEAVYECPYCGAEAHANYVDIGVGLQQCDPFICSGCGSYELYGDFEDLTKRENLTGWREVINPPWRQKPETTTELPF